VKLLLTTLGGEAGASPVTAAPAATDPASSVRLLANRPNPFNPSTVIPIEAPAGTAGPVRVVIFDVTGRAVRTLAEEPLVSGRHLLTWDGLDAQGRPAASGVYFCRMEADGAAAVRRLVLVR
jgi:hypothetical protein